MNGSPVVLFVYNRPEHTTRAIESLRNNRLAPQTDLVVYCDGSRDRLDQRNVARVHEIVDRTDGFNRITIIKRESNVGLAHSIINGVTEVIEQYGTAIVLEDDLITSPAFLDYMNSALMAFEGEPAVFSVGGYAYPRTLLEIPAEYREDVFFSPRPTSWGWATWANRWRMADWQARDFNTVMQTRGMRREFNRGGEDLTGMLQAQQAGEIDSWAILWCLTHFLHHGVAAWPVHSYVQNIGHDATGLHCGATDRYRTPLADSCAGIRFPRVVYEHPGIMRNFRRVFRRRLLGRIKRSVKRRLDADHASLPVRYRKQLHD